MLKINFFLEHVFIERIRVNEREVLGELYLRYEKMVFSYIRNHGGSTEDAEDLLQEALVVLWQKVNSGTFELKSKLSTYIMAVVKNMWMAEHRKKYHQNRDEFPLQVSDSNPGTLDTLVENEQIQIVHQALKEISDLCRQLLSMFYFEEKPLDDLVQILGFANTNVAKSKKYQCKKALEKLVQQKLVNQEGN